MIVKSSARTGATALAKHLISTQENETVRVSGSRDVCVREGREVLDALHMMDALAVGTVSRKHNLYHISFNPERDLNAQQWADSWNQYEKEFGLEQQPFIEVTHLKNDRLHKHRVYPLATEDGDSINVWHSFQRNEKIARILEHSFDHPLTLGKHNRAVIKYLKEEGREEIATWMEQQLAHQRQRPVAEKNHDDHQQEKRTNLSVTQVKADLQSAWDTTRNGAEFQESIAEKSYQLARGDRRDFVIVDGAGGIHSPRRRLGVKAKELREKWADLTLEELPTVGEIRNQSFTKKKADEEDETASTDTMDVSTIAHVELLNHWALRTTQEENEKREAANDDNAVGREEDVRTSDVVEQSQQPPSSQVEEQESLQEDSVKDQDERQRIKQWLDKRKPEREHSKPRRQPITRQKARGEKVLRQVGGDKSLRKREQPIRKILKTGLQPPQVNKQESRAVPQPLSHVRAKQGRSLHRMSDKWLAQRLAKRGYSRGRIRAILQQSSPELLMEDPTQRHSIIRRIVERAYRREERHQQEAVKKQKVQQEKTQRKLQKQPFRSKTPQTNQSQIPDSKTLEKRRLYQIKVAQQALQSRDYKGYRGQAVREYRKELARKMNTHGREIIQGETGFFTDKDIAIRLYAAGFSQRQVKHAIHTASPQTAGYGAEVKAAYINKHINPALKHPKAREAQQFMWEWRKENNLTHERRLDQQGLETEMKKDPKHEPEHQR